MRVLIWISIIRRIMIKRFGYVIEPQMIRTQQYVLPPHPRPLPVEGRGRSTRSGAPLRLSRRGPWSLEKSSDSLPNATLEPTSTGGGSPSPLNGERAGVRGENDPLPSDNPVILPSKAKGIGLE